MSVCRVCGSDNLDIRPGGQTWRGTKGYTEPQYYSATHFCKNFLDDEFVSIAIQYRGRTEEQIRSLFQKMNCEGGT